MAEKVTALVRRKGGPPARPRSRARGSREFSPVQLISQAIDRGLDMGSIERLAALRDRVVAEQAKHEYFDALRQLQAKLQPISRTRAVKNKRERVEAGESVVRFRYAPIEKIVPVLQPLEEEFGFSHTFGAGEIKGTSEGGLIPVSCIIHHVGGHEETTWFPSPIFYADGKAIGQSKAQTVNSAISFGRRVALLLGYGVVTADPDPEGTEAERAEEEGQGPRSVEETQGDGESPEASDEELRHAYDKVQKLIAAKCKGKAADTFKATASKHLQKGRADLLLAMAKSLDSMRQGTRG